MAVCARGMQKLWLRGQWRGGKIFLLVLLWLCLSVAVYVLVVRNSSSSSSSPLSLFPWDANPHPEVFQAFSSRRNGSLFIRPWNCSQCNQWNYSVVLNQRGVCHVPGPNHTVHLVLLIPSSHGNRTARDAVRGTWGSIADNANATTSGVRRVFFLGTTRDAARMREAEEESRHFRDVVILGMEDTYRNLTLKTLMMLTWLSQECPRARYFLKVDDDVWVNTGALMDRLSKAGTDLHNAIGGYCKMHPRVLREPGKWSATYAEYPANAYPKYCSGTAYTSSVQVATRVLAASRGVPFFFLEDVFVGLCIKQLGVGVRHLNGFNMRVPDRVKKDGCHVWDSGLVTVHKVLPDTLRQYWATPKCH
ncbi:beta-1,3-galactosyltransferase 5-like [Babylonia areolata]|uniref:beta-1,3-galactosyltransferase 5-like n=1 Tax=Babylonia areolata TaxID=304850 RepID=UPI003FD54290